MLDERLSKNKIGNTSKQKESRSALPKVLNGFPDKLKSKVKI
jgi:hypothetical protein